MQDSGLIIDDEVFTTIDGTNHRFVVSIFFEWSVYSECVATTRRWTRCRMVWFTKCKRWPNIAHVHEWCRKQSTTDCYCRHAVSFTDMIGESRPVTWTMNCDHLETVAPRRRRGRTLGIWIVSRWSNVDDRATRLGLYFRLSRWREVERHPVVNLLRGWPSTWPRQTFYILPTISGGYKYFLF